MNLSEWPPLKGLTVQSTGTQTSPPGTTYGPRKQLSWEFVWIRSSVMRVTVNSTRLKGGPGTIFLIPPGVTDRYDSSKRGPMVSSFLHFHCGTPPLGWPKLSRWPLMRVLPEQNILFALFEQVLRFSPLADGRFGPLLNPSVELMLRLYLSGNFEDVPSGWEAGLSPATERVIQWLKRSIEKNPDRKIRLEDMAREAAVSAQHLCRLFKKDLQIGPMECARLLRVETSGTLLERTRLSLKEIAQRCGFENPFHFSRVFKAVYGLPPQRYRAGFLKGTLFRPGSLVFRRYRHQWLLLNRRVDPIATESYRMLPKRYQVRMK
ncbi:MAG: helix-turn-helix domain-containing protein [bacterium]